MFVYICGNDNKQDMTDVTNILYTCRCNLFTYKFKSNLQSKLTYLWASIKSNRGLWIYTYLDSLAPLFHLILSIHWHLYCIGTLISLAPLFHLILSFHWHLYCIGTLISLAPLFHLILSFHLILFSWFLVGLALTVNPWL